MADSRASERAVFEALCTVVRGDPSALQAMPGAQVPDLLRIARLHGVEAWLAMVAPRDLPGWDALEAQRVRFHAARMRTDAVLRDLDTVFTGLRCPWAVLKGPALARSVYPRPELRHGVDLDVLVPPRRFEQVLPALVEDAGFELLERNWPLIDRWCPGELKLRSPRGVLLDLHWSLFAGADLRRAYRLPSAELLDRVRLLADHTPALDGTDQLLHVATHAAMSGGNRLSWLLDLDLSARAAPDWTELARRARASRTARTVAVVLQRARVVLGSPVPASMLTELTGGRAWQRVNGAVDRLSPVGPDPESPSLARAWARSTRGSAAATLTEFARHSSGWLRAGHPRTRAPSVLTDASNPASPLYPVEDAAARTRYLAAVGLAE